MKWDTDGNPIFSARIFRDPECRPSVYRESLCAGPSSIQQDIADGVLTLSAEALRGSAPVPRYKEQMIIEQQHGIDVEHKPEGPPGTTDYAHSEIFLDPMTTHGGTCNRMYEALALLAVDAWAIRPGRIR
jgi:hypothetical protein